MSENNYDVTAKRLRKAIGKAGISACELARRSGVSKYSISQYTNAKHSPSNHTAYAMAQVLDVSPAWLMGFDVPMNEELKASDSAEYDFIHLEKYHKLSEHDRKLIDEIIYVMLKGYDND